MSYHYLYSAIAPIPYGYSAYNQVPVQSISKKLILGSCEIMCEFSYLIEGEEIQKDSYLLIYKDFELVNKLDTNSQFIWTEEFKEKNPGFVVWDIYSQDNERIFKNRSPLGSYVSCLKLNNKSLFIDYSYRVGDPQIINQMSEWGRFIITYGVVDIDINRDCSNSFIFINPYNKPIVVSFSTSDNRNLKRVKIPPNYSICYQLSDILNSGEHNWNGSIQFTANNRIVSYVVSHSFKNKNKLSDIEHLDPFRSDPTHARYLQTCRQKFGKYLKRF